MGRGEALEAGQEPMELLRPLNEEVKAEEKSEVTGQVEVKVRWCVACTLTRTRDADVSWQQDSKLPLSWPITVKQNTHTHTISHACAFPRPLYSSRAAL